MLKKRFPILSDMKPFSFETQVLLVRVLCMVHNLILTEGDDGQWLYENESQEPGHSKEDDGELEERESPVNRTMSAFEKTRVKRWRDGIAEAMWQDYQQYCRH